MDLTKFLTELLRRLMADTPWFFRGVRIISVITAIVLGLPGLLTYMCENMELCIQIPDAWNAIYTKVGSIAAVVSAFIAQLTATTDAKKASDLKD